MFSLPPLDVLCAYYALEAHSVTRKVRRKRQFLKCCRSYINFFVLFLFFVFFTFMMC